MPDRQIKFSIYSRHFRISSNFDGLGVTVVTLNEKRRRVNVADNLMNSLAFFNRRDHNDDITETLSKRFMFISSLFIGSLFSLRFWRRCLSNNVTKIFIALKSHYLHVIFPTLIRLELLNVKKSICSDLYSK